MDPQRPGPDAAPGIRASDTERDRVIGLLKEHHVDGRLSVDELSERSTTVYAARTRDELAMVLWDLPVMAPAPAPASVPARAAARSPVTATRAAVAALVLVLLTLLAAGALMLGFASAETDSVDVPREAPRVPGPPEAPRVPDPEAPRGPDLPEAPQLPG